MLPRSARKSADSWVSWVGWRRSSRLTRSSNCTEPLYSHTSSIALKCGDTGIKNANKLDKLNERALRFVFNDVTLTYDKLLRTPSTADRRMQDYRIVTYKAPNNQAPRYIRALLEERSTTKNLPGTTKLAIPRVQTTTYGLHSFRYGATKLWNSLTDSVRTAETTGAFKNKIRLITFTECDCKQCKEHLLETDCSTNF